jgi:hypothetical protein
MVGNRRFFGLPWVGPEKDMRRQPSCLQLVTSKSPIDAAFDESVVTT